MNTNDLCRGTPTCDRDDARLAPLGSRNAGFSRSERDLLRPPRMRTTLLAASLAVLTACGGAVAPAPGDPNGQGPSNGGNPGGSNPTNPSGSNPGGNPANPTEPQPGQPAQPGDPAPTASVTGNVNGAPFTFNSVIAMRQVQRDSEYVFVVVSNRTFTCAELQTASTNNETFANMNLLMVGVVSTNATPLTWGTFAIGTTASGSSQQGIAIVETSDAACSYKQNQAQSGSITIDALTDEQISGDFKATFGSGEQLAGSFSTVPVCDLGAPNDSQSGTPACLP
jgi:hypothetical protein